MEKTITFDEILERVEELKSGTETALFNNVSVVSDVVFEYMGKRVGDLCVDRIVPKSEVLNWVSNFPEYFND